MRRSISRITAVTLGMVLSPGARLEAKMSLILSPGEKTGVSDQEYQIVLGDSPFSSGHPVLQKMNPRVTEIHIRLN